MKQILLFVALFFPFYTIAQLKESFDGPEVTTAYPWKGDTDKFIINEQKELQLKGNHFKDDAFLYLSSVPLYDNKWNFMVRSDYQGTTSNYFKIYLWSEKPDMDNPGEAVFIRLGYTKKNIALCYQIGNRTPEVLLQGRALFKAAQQVEVKVETDKNGLCTVYSKSLSDEDFVLEGSADLPTYGGDGCFMMGVFYSADNNRNKYIDSIEIDRFTLTVDTPEDPDEPDVPLELLDMTQEDAYTLMLHFNQTIDITEASFTLGELGEPIDIDFSQETFILSLCWNEPMIEGKEYVLEFDGIYKDGFEYYGDVSWTSLYGDNQPAEPEKPEPAAYGTVVINEIMADPKGLTELPETEYVELYNTISEDISLKGWSFIYDDREIELADYLFPAESYLVLCRKGVDLYVGGSGESMPLDKFPAKLANDGKALQLVDATGTIVDLVIYEKAKPGRSWERQGTEWYYSSDERGGTPGEVNSKPGSDPEDPVSPTLPLAQPGDIVFNEILPNPYPDGSEYIELYNRTGQDLSLVDLAIATRKADGSLSTTYSLSDIQQIKANDYALLTRNRDGVSDWYWIQTPENIYELKLPVLNNVGATLVLFRTEDEEVIDELSYSSKWHSYTIKEEKGVALERIHPDKETQNPDNWTSAAATAGYGTPGYLNSQYGIPKTNSTSGIEKPQYSKDTGLYSILYYMDQPGYSCHAHIYDLSGRKVADIANNELLGTEGKLIWNGTGSNGARLQTGLYILYIELYNHTKGKVKEYKEAFLVY